MKTFLTLLTLFVATVASAQLSNIWNPDSQILVIGEQHSVEAISSLVLNNLTDLKAAGAKNLALELPVQQQDNLDKFANAAKSLDWLSQKLWETGYAQLPVGYKLKLQMLDWARQNGVKTWAIDADRNLLYKIGCLHTIAINGGIPCYTSPDEDNLVRERGIDPNLQNLTATEANQLGWQLWTNGRTEVMAKNLAKITKKNPGERIVVLCGNLHADLAPYKAIATAAGFDLSQVKNDSIEAYLPEALRTKTQTVSLQGGFGYQGNPDGLARSPQLTEVERHIVKNRLTNEVVSIRTIEGYTAIDSVIVLPLVKITTVAANP